MRRRSVVILTVFTSALLSCNDAIEAQPWVTPKDALTKYGLLASGFSIQKGQIVGTVVNTSSNGYKSANLLVHIYDPNGARLKEQMVTTNSLWAGETIKVSETVLYLTAAEQKGATAEVKAVKVEP
jgi:microcompartment protein CcmK/EutM